MLVQEKGQGKRKGGQTKKRFRQEPAVQCTGGGGPRNHKISHFGGIRVPPHTSLRNFSMFLSGDWAVTQKVGVGVFPKGWSGTAYRTRCPVPCLFLLIKIICGPFVMYVKP